MGQNTSQPSQPLPFAVLKIDESAANKSHDSAYSKIFIGGAIGAGMPGFSYGATSLYKFNPNGNSDTLHTPGYAKTGFQFNFKGGYYISDHTGIMIQIGGNMNGFNSEGFKTNSYLSNYSNVSVSATSHYIGSYLAGVIFNMPVGVASTCDKLSINFSVLAGLMTAHYSTVSATYTDSMNVTHSTVTKIQTASAFAFDMGTGVMYNFSHLIGLDLNFDLLAGNPAFTSYTITETGGSSVTYNNRTIGMSTILFNTSLGIVLTLK